MTILLTVASKHGSTREIGEVLADELRSQGIHVDLRKITEVEDPEADDGVIIGSAMYMGSWLPEAREFIHTHADALRGRAVWLFSSGPLGRDDLQPSGDPPQIEDSMAATGAREHRIFVGKLDKQHLGFGERLAVKLVKAPNGDFRDWAAVRAWAREIATVVHTTPSPVEQR